MVLRLKFFHILGFANLFLFNSITHKFVCILLKCFSFSFIKRESVRFVEDEPNGSIIVKKVCFFPTL